MGNRAFLHVNARWEGAEDVPGNESHDAIIEAKQFTAVAWTPKKQVPKPKRYQLLYCYRSPRNRLSTNYWMWARCTTRADEKNDRNKSRTVSVHASVDITRTYNDVDWPCNVRYRADQRGQFELSSVRGDQDVKLHIIHHGYYIVCESGNHARPRDMLFALKSYRAGSQCILILGY